MPGAGFSIRSQALWAPGSAGGLAPSETDKVVAVLGDTDNRCVEARHALGEMGEGNRPFLRHEDSRPTRRGLPSRSHGKDLGRRRAQGS
jgi:hypothetical protein